MKPNTRILSVIVPVMKDTENILKTYRSLQGVLGDLVELVIQDHKGLSGLRNHISDPNVILIEASDTDIADANNLAAGHANGKYLMFWGAGEEAIKDEFLKAVEYVNANPVDIVFNSTRLPAINRVGTPAPQNMEKEMQCLTAGVMISKELFFRCGMLDPKYPVATDYAMFIKLLRATSNYVVRTEAVVDYPLGGMSHGPRVLEAVIEQELIRVRLCQKPPVLAAIDLITTCAWFLRQHTILPS